MILAKYHLINLGHKSKIHIYISYIATMLFVSKIKKCANFLLPKTPYPIQFLVIGAQHAGGDIVEFLLRQHPNISLPVYVNHPIFSENGNLFQTQNFNSYHQSLAISTKNKVIGDMSMNSLYCQPAARRIYLYNPKIKIIVILRNPIERAFAHWQFNYTNKLETLSFEQALLNEKNRAIAALPYQDFMYSYLDAGFYSEQIRRYQRFYKDHHLLFITHENLVAQPQATFDTMCDFLTIKRFNIQAEYSTDSQHTLSISSETYQQLINLYQYDIREVERLTHSNVSDWLINPISNK